MELVILIIVVIALAWGVHHRCEILKGVQYNSDILFRIESKLDELLKKDRSR